MRGDNIIKTLMDSSSRPLWDGLNESPFVWDKKFSIRREKAYLAEDKRLAPQSDQTIMDAFIQERLGILYLLPYDYAALRSYVAQAQLSNLTASTTPAQHTNRLVLLDDRRDASGGERSTRNWDSYTEYPPEGDRRWTGLLDAGAFYRKLMEKVSEAHLEDWSPADSSRDKTAVPRDVPCKLLTKDCHWLLTALYSYIADMTPLCALAVVASASRLHAPILREYLQRYISHRVFFGVSIVSHYAD